MEQAPSWAVRFKWLMCQGTTQQGDNDNDTRITGLGCELQAARYVSNSLIINHNTCKNSLSFGGKKQQQTVQNQNSSVSENKMKCHFKFDYDSDELLRLVFTTLLSHSQPALLI